MKVMNTVFTVELTKSEVKLLTELLANEVKYRPSSNIDVVKGLRDELGALVNIAYVD